MKGLFGEEKEECLMESLSTIQRWLRELTLNAVGVEDDKYAAIVDVNGTRLSPIEVKAPTRTVAHRGGAVCINLDSSIRTCVKLEWTSVRLLANFATDRVAVLRFVQVGPIWG